MNGPDKRMLEREALRNMIQQWNMNRLDLFELSEPNEDLSFHGVMRFYFQDSGQKVATKCIRVASDATAADVIETLIEKFRPDMRMLSVASYALYELHSHEERRLANDEKPLLVQLNWHIDDREGRFLLRNIDDKTSSTVSNVDANSNFKRKLSKREKKELKKKEKLSRIKSDAGKDEDYPVAEKLYTELPETSFTRSISNPEAVMRRRRQQKLEKKLQQFRSKDGGPDTGGTLKIYGESLCSDVPYKTLLLSINDCAASVVKEMLDKYGLGKFDPQLYCLIQVDSHDNSEYILDDDECPLAIVMTHPHRGSIMFHVRRRPADQPRRRKKKSGSLRTGAGGPCAGVLLETQPDGTPLDNGRNIRLTSEVVEVGSANGVALQLYGPSIQSTHCVIAAIDGVVTITPLHADAHTYINGQQIVHTTLLQHGCLIKFGRASTFRFIDSGQDNSLNRNPSQSHLDSGSVYDRSPTSPVPDNVSGVMSPSLHSQLDGIQGSIESSGMNTTGMSDLHRAMSPSSNVMAGSQDNFSVSGYNSKQLRMPGDMSSYTNNKSSSNIEGDSNITHSKSDLMSDNYLPQHYNDMSNPQAHGADANNISSNKHFNMDYKDNYETTFDLDGNVETKSVCSIKSAGSGNDSRLPRGQEAILPAVLEFPEHTQQLFLHSVITELDVETPTFKLAPVYTLYLCARYRASTHYRPELSPNERAHKLTILLQHVATLIQNTVQERHADANAEAFWLANGSELLHFLKSDRHICAFSTQAQTILANTVQLAFGNLVGCFHVELSSVLAQWLDEPGSEAAGSLLLGALGSAMALLRRCRVNAALTIQLFSQLFHFINVWCFNKVVHSPHMWRAAWGIRLRERLAPLSQWAERQGLELAADCHLATIHQCAHLLQAPKTSIEEMVNLSSTCLKLNSIQLSCLLGGFVDENGRRLPPELVQAAIQHAQSMADELHRADGREITLEESSTLPLSLLIPEDGFSAEVMRGLSDGLADFLAPLQRAGLCRLAPQPHSQGHWTVYMNGYQGGGVVASPPQQPLIQVIKLHKNSNGMGLSIVAAKGAGQSKLGIYIKSVVPGGAAAADQRLQAGDQLLSVDGHSLVGISQERAAEFLVRTGPVVTLQVAKQGAVLHGLATLLRQPSPNRAGPRRMSERDLSTVMDTEQSNQQSVVKSSKSVPALHEVFNPGYSRTSSSTSIPTLSGLRNRPSQHANNDPNNFYQNLSTYKHSALPDRSISNPKNSQVTDYHNNAGSLQQPSKAANRPQSAYVTSPPQMSATQLHAGYPSMPNVNENYNMNINVRMGHGGQHQDPSGRMWKQPPSPRTPQSGHQTHLHSSQPLHLVQRPTYLADDSLNMNQQMTATAKQTPPVAPKPQGLKKGSSSDMISQSMMQQDIIDIPPLPPTTTHPLFQPPEEGAGYLASTSEPPAVSLYPHNTITSPPQAQALSNPWQREEREKEMEARRSAARVWRDKQISALQALGEENRTPQQEQQLRALTLERDFQRRAQEAQSEEEEKNIENNENSYPENENVSQHMKQEATIVSPPQETKVISPPVQPKSILKSNLRLDNLNTNSPQSPSKTQKNTSFATTKPTVQSLKFDNVPKYEINLQKSSDHSKYDHNVNNKPIKNEFSNNKYPEQIHKMVGKYQEQDYSYNNFNLHSTSKFEHNISNNNNNTSMKEMTQNISNMNISNNTLDTPEHGHQHISQEDELYNAPPPPERGSSFAVMSHQQAIRSSIGPPVIDTVSSQPPRDKRVSFHHNSPPQETSAISTPIESVREDPDKFIMEAESLLQSPTTPTSHTHTPGVIGAQEVYRDPRQKRLAEQQKAQEANSPIPEKLSFKEKMKMFALESGESNTPKDKVKISRAQRDIDAVH